MKSFISVDRSILMYPEKYDLSGTELLFLLAIKCHALFPNQSKTAYLTDEKLGYAKRTATRLRGLLKQKEYITYYSTQGLGTIYYINIEKLKNINDEILKEKKAEKEKKRKEYVDRCIRKMFKTDEEYSNAIGKYSYEVLLDIATEKGYLRAKS